MKAILSTTIDPVYQFNLPIVAWAWKQLNVQVVCFMPSLDDSYFKTVKESEKAFDRLQLISYNRLMQNVEIHTVYFKCPPEKAATYAQVSRLFGCCLNLPEDEILISSDVDMLLLKLPYIASIDVMTTFGIDLTPPGQLPICYASGSVKSWRRMLNFNNESYQEMLDLHLAHENCENMRGNLWSRDQELLYNCMSGVARIEMHRARPGTQFASNRVDRDDSFWEKRLNEFTIDAHLWRPLWEPANFEKLLKLLRFKWPEKDFGWVIEYRNEYVKLL